MATDPMTLLAQASCYACYLESDDVMTLALMAQWVGNTNLVPIGSVYNNGGLGPTLPLVSGQTYHITLIAPLAGNDLSVGYSNGVNNTQINAPVTKFLFTPTTFQGLCQIVFLSGVANSPVTAILVSP